MSVPQVSNENVADPPINQEGRDLHDTLAGLALLAPDSDSEQEEEEELEGEGSEEGDEDQGVDGEAAEGDADMEGGDETDVDSMELKDSETVDDAEGLGVGVLVTLDKRDQTLTKREMAAMKLAADKDVEAWCLGWLETAVRRILETHPERRLQALTLGLLLKKVLANHPSKYFKLEGHDLKKRSPRLRGSFRTVFTETATSGLKSLGFAQNGDAIDVLLIHHADTPLQAALLSYDDVSRPLVDDEALHDFYGQCQPARNSATDGAYGRIPPKAADIQTRGTVGKAANKKTRQTGHDKKGVNHLCRDLADRFPLKTWLAKSLWTWGPSKTSDLPDPIRSVIETKLIALFKTIEAKHSCQINLVDFGSFNGSGRASRITKSSEIQALQDGMTLWKALHRAASADPAERFPKALAINKSSSVGVASRLARWVTTAQRLEVFPRLTFDDERIRLAVNALFGHNSEWVWYSRDKIGPLSLHPDLLAFKAKRPISVDRFQGEKKRKARGNRLLSAVFEVGFKQGGRIAERSRGNWSAAAARESRPFIEKLRLSCEEVVNGSQAVLQTSDSLEFHEHPDRVTDILSDSYQSQADHWLNLLP